MLHTFITDNVAPGSTVITDGWSGYLGIDKVGYTHDRRSQRAAKALGEDIGKLLPGVHRVASLAKRWLLSTHQGAVAIEHLPGYLDEFCSPVQPSPFTQPWPGLPAITPARRRSRPGPLPAADQTTPATQGAATAARSDRAPAQHRPAPGYPPLATA